MTDKANISQAFEQSSVPAEIQEIPPADTTTPADGPITRFTANDLGKYSWMVPKLRGFWPHIHPNSVNNWVAGYSNSNQASFLKIDGAVGLVVLEYEIPSPTPFVREVFVFLEDDKNDAPGIALYREFIKWAKRLKVSDFRGIGGGSDVKLSRIKAVFKPQEYRAIVIPLMDAKE